MANPIVQRVAAAQGNSFLADQLIRDYLPFIRSEIAKMNAAAEGDELSIAMIGFHEAIESYQADRGAFLSYASLVMKNRLIDYYRSEARHRSVSLSSSLGDEDLTLEDTLVDPKDEAAALEDRSATAAEIEELSDQLVQFGLSLSDIADHTPKQERTFQSAQAVLRHAREHPEIIRELLRTKKLPIKQLVSATGVNRKVIERHRKYLMALMIIYSNGYDIIRDHIGMTFIKEGGARQ